MGHLRAGLVLAFAALLAGCAEMAPRPEVPVARRDSAAYGEWIKAPLRRVTRTGAGESRGHVLGDVTVYGLASAPVRFHLRHERLSHVLDALGGLPRAVLAPIGRGPLAITECRAVDDDRGFSFTLRDVERRHALVLVARIAGKRVIVAQNVEGAVDVDVHDVSPAALLEALARPGGLVIVADAAIGPTL